VPFFPEKRTDKILARGEFMNYASQLLAIWISDIKNCVKSDLVHVPKPKGDHACELVVNVFSVILWLLLLLPPPLVRWNV
jgi:hypothetical protein